MSEDREDFTLVKGKRYKAQVHLSGFEDMASNETIVDMMTNYGFIDIEVTGDGREREGSATWAGETVTGPLDKHIVEISEVVTTPTPAPTPTPASVIVEPVVVPDSPPVFEKVEKKVTSRHEEDDDNS